MTHIIKKQVVEITLTEKKAAFRLQALISESYWRDMVRILEKAFDEVANPGETIQIDRLEIDLGNISEKDIEKGRWIDMLFSKILEKLKLIKKVNLPGTKTYVHPDTHTVSDQWLYYMQHGHLPWNLKQADTLWYVQVLEAFATDSAAIDKLRNYIQRSSNIVERILNQHDQNFVVSLIEALTARNYKSLALIIDEIVQIISFINFSDKNDIISKKKMLQRQLWREVLLFAANVEQETRTPETFLGYILNKVYGAQIAAAVLPSRLLSGKLTGKIIREFITANKTKEKSSKKRSSEENNLLADGEFIPDKKDPGDTNTMENQLDKLFEQAENNIEYKADTYPLDDGHLEDEAIYVQHAGLVLLHVFLKPFFNNLGLIDKSGFIDTLSQQKSLFLLYYLATGNTIAAENELVIEKLLCGYPLQMPVPTTVELSQEEKNEADELLKNVIHHWKILKNTSIDGLRETFLQRSGKLEMGQNGPLLQVERTAIDLLLDDLPWNYSMIQLPWRNDLIRVEW